MPKKTVRLLPTALDYKNKVLSLKEDIPIDSLSLHKKNYEYSRQSICQADAGWRLSSEFTISESALQAIRLASMDVSDSSFSSSL